MNEDMERLMRYAHRFGKDGNWLVNQGDAIPSLEALESLGMIVRNEEGNKWKLSTSEIDK